MRPRGGRPGRAGASPAEALPFRALSAQVPWRALVAGWAAAYAAGVLVGLGIQALGWWEGAPWERAVLAAAGRAVSPVLDPIMLLLPLAGTNYTLAPVVAVVAVVLWRRGLHATALQLATVQLGSWTLNPAIKFTLPRPRPDLFEPRGQYALPAYPSGHAIAVVSLLVTAAYLARLHGRAPWAYPAVAAFFLLNSYSRLYLGVHWPTDLAGGTLVGAIWLATTLRAFAPLHR